MEDDQTLREWLEAILSNRWLRWGLVIIVASVILYGSVISTPPEVVIDTPSSGGEPGDSGVDNGGESSPGPERTESGQSDEIELFATLSAVVGFTESQWRHIVAYATLAGALASATGDWELQRRYHILFAIAVASLYGLGIEFLQLFVSQRSTQVGDMLANTFGASLLLPVALVGTLRRAVSRRC